MKVNKLYAYGTVITIFMLFVTTTIQAEEKQEPPANPIMGMMNPGMMMNPMMGMMNPGMMMNPMMGMMNPGMMMNPMMGMMNPGMMMNPMMGMMNPGMMMNPMMGMMNPGMMMNPMMGSMGGMGTQGGYPMAQMMDPKQYEQWFSQWNEMMKNFTTQVQTQ